MGRHDNNEKKTALFNRWLKHQWEENMTLCNRSLKQQLEVVSLFNRIIKHLEDLTETEKQEWEEPWHFVREVLNKNWKKT